MTTRTDYQRRFDVQPSVRNMMKQTTRNSRVWTTAHAIPNEPEVRWVRSWRETLYYNSPTNLTVGWLEWFNRHDRNCRMVAW